MNSLTRHSPHRISTASNGSREPAAARRQPRNRVCVAGTGFGAFVRRVRSARGWTVEQARLFWGLNWGSVLSQIEAGRLVTVPRAMATAVIMSAEVGGVAVPDDIAELVGRDRGTVIGNRSQAAGHAAPSAPSAPSALLPTTCDLLPSSFVRPIPTRHGTIRLWPGRVVRAFDDPMVNQVVAGPVRLIRKLVTYGRLQTGWLVEALDGPLRGTLVEKWFCS